MANGVVLTIHGVGFQTPPNINTGIGGYADGLHKSLLTQKPLQKLLGSDPAGEFGRQPNTGPIYVESEWHQNPTDTSSPLTRSAGLARLDDVLFQEGRSIAHIALVYYDLENTGFHPMASLETLADVIGSWRRYGTLPSILDKAGDVGALIGGLFRGGPAKVPAPGLTSRDHPSSAAMVIPRLDQDVAAYVCRDDLRTELRDFATEVIQRLFGRRQNDVAWIAVNGHSQGTVLAYDILRRLDADEADRTRLFITSGSPLRKYAAFFSWCAEVSSLRHVRWINFWDPTDPVADPLTGPLPNDPDNRGLTSLFYYLNPDSGVLSPVKPAVDAQVNNLQTGGGILPAHDYWANTQQVVSKMATELAMAATR